MRWSKEIKAGWYHATGIRVSATGMLCTLSSAPAHSPHVRTMYQDVTAAKLARRHVYATKNYPNKYVQYVHKTSVITYRRCWETSMTFVMASRNRPWYLHRQQLVYTILAAQSHRVESFTRFRTKVKESCKMAAMNCMNEHSSS